MTEPVENPNIGRVERNRLAFLEQRRQHDAHLERISLERQRRMRDGTNHDVTRARPQTVWPPR